MSACRRRTARCPICGAVRRRRPLVLRVTCPGVTVRIRIPVVGRRGRVRSYGPCPTVLRVHSDGYVQRCDGTMLLPRDAAYVLRAMRACERAGWPGGGMASEYA